MVILIPSVIIFLAFSYLQLADDVTLFEKIIVYLIIISTILISIKLYKGIKKDIKQQQINGAIIEIKKLESLLLKKEDIKEKEFIVKKIEKLKKELEL